MTEPLKDRVPGAVHHLVLRRARDTDLNATKRKTYACKTKT
jgi:hypothetical protein